MNRTYETDVTDRQWEMIKNYFPIPEKMGRPKKYSPREILNGIFYLDKTGVHWRLLPKDFPPWSAVYYYFSLWTRNGLLDFLHKKLCEGVRASEGREINPTAAIIDSQSTKGVDTTGDSGYDAGKKIKGSKKHILVDTLGLILAVVVHSAAIQDRDGAEKVFEKYSAMENKRIELVWADGGYSGDLVEKTEIDRDFEIQIVKKDDKFNGFKILPRRWVVERTFSWLDRNRRLSKNYERKNEHAESLIKIAMIKLMQNRLIPF